MNIREFFDLPEEERQVLIDLHNKQKSIRNTRESIDIERRKLTTREFNNQTECQHPFTSKVFQTFGASDGGEYRYRCDDCGFIWYEKE